MKRSIRLFISGKLVDISSSSLISFNYLADDLSNPTTVQNSYTRPIEIPATAGNNAIFEGFTRLDRVTGQNGYNPLKRAEFAIYDDSGVVLEKGYAKLDSVSTKGGSAYSYSVSLYGGLGALFYSLMYDDEGNNLSLASLSYLSGDDDELDFNITRAEVRKAWQQIAGAYSSEVKYNVINFAPCYNGIPDKNFDAGKAIFVPSDCDLNNTSGDYGLKSGYALVNFSEKQDEWAVKDFRSYLQRPVIKMKAILEAIKTFAATKGFTINYSGSFFEDNPYYDETWLTLPMLNELTTGSGEEGTETIDAYLIMSLTDQAYQALDIPLSSESDFSVDVALQSYPNSTCTHLGVNPSGRTTHYQNAYFLQLAAVDAQYNYIAVSPVKVLCSYTRGYDASEMVTMAGYTPIGGAPVDPELSIGAFASSGQQVWNQPIHFDLTGVQGAARLYLFATAKPFESTIPGSSDSFKLYTFPATEQSGSTMDSITKEAKNRKVSMTGTCTYETEGQTMRSGALITKQMLLGGSHTPADYLISYAKMCGLQFVYDAPTKTVNVMSRGGAFADGRSNPLNIESRIDRSRDFSFKPYLISKRYLDFEQELSGGQWTEYYKSVYGNSYGVQRVNTGYEFNGEHEKVLDGLAFNGCAEVLERTKTFIKVTTSSDKPYPAPFITADNTYTLYDSDDSTTEIPIPAPDSYATIGYYNDSYKGYDAIPKAQFHADELKPIDGKDCLLFYAGSDDTYSDFLLSDDIAAMLTLNDGVPCYMLEKSTYRIGDDFVVPSFRRYKVSGTSVKRTLDMGTPQEIDNPDFNTTGMANRSLYKLFWNNYIADRYDKDAKVLTCYVDFRGIQVGSGLLRRMYYFDNCLWVLNRITDYDVTSHDSVLCEFIKVKDKNAYADTTTGDLVTTVAPTALTFGADSASQTIVITSTDAWEFDNIPSWLTASQSSGGTAGTETTTTVTLTAAAYSGEEERSINLLIQGTDSSCELAVSQSSHVYTYALQSISSGNLGAEGGTYTPQIYGVKSIDGVAQPAQLLTTADGAYLTEGSGDTYNQFSVSGLSVVAVNLGTNARSAKTITFTCNWHGQTATFTVTQAANTYTDGAVTCQITVNPWNGTSTIYASAAGDTTTFTYNAYVPRTWSSGSVQQVAWNGTPTFSVTSGVGLTRSGQTLTWARNETAYNRDASLYAYNGGTLIGTAYLHQFNSSVTYQLEAIGNHNFSEYGGTWTPTIYGLTFVNGTQTSRRQLTASDGVTLTKGTDTHNQFSASGITITAVDLELNNRSAADVYWIAEWNGAVQGFHTTQDANVITYSLDAVPNKAFTAAGGTYAVDPMASIYRNDNVGWRGRLTAADGCSIVKGSGDRFGKMSISGFTITAADLMTTAYDAVSVAFSLVWTGKATVNFTCTQDLNMEISQYENPTDLVMLFVDSQQTEISDTVLSTGRDVYLKGRYIYELWGRWSSGHDAYYAAGQTQIVNLTNITVEPQSGITVHPYTFAYLTVAAQAYQAAARQWNVLGKYTNSAGTTLTAQRTLKQNAGYRLEWEYTMLSLEWAYEGSGQTVTYAAYNDRSYKYFYAKQTVNVYKVADGNRTLYETYVQGSGAPISISDTTNFNFSPTTIDGDNKGYAWARSNNTSGSARQCVVRVSAIDNPSSYLEIVLIQQSA